RRRPAAAEGDLHDRGPPPRVPVDDRPRADEADADRAHRRRRLPVRRGRRPRPLPVPLPAPLLLAGSRRLPARVAARHPRRRPRPRRRQGDTLRRVHRLDDRPYRRGVHARLDRARVRAPGQRRRARVRLRRRRRLLPRQLHARACRGAVAARRCRHRQPRRAGGGDHGRAGARSLGRAAMGHLPARRDGLADGRPAHLERPRTTPPGRGPLALSIREESCSYTASSLSASSSRRTGVLVRMPASLKGALVREVARRGGSLNDTAVGMLADTFGVAYRPSGRRSPLPGASPVVLLRVPAELKERLDAEARRTGSSTNDVILRALADALDVPLTSHRGKEAMASTNGSENGRTRSNGKVRVALIGVGNCANSLLQGVEYYRNAPDDKTVPGLMHVNLGGYHISDIEFVAAFDVVKGKVGLDLADAIWAHPNDTIKFAEVPKTGVKVSRGMTHDGIGKYLAR